MILLPGDIVTIGTAQDIASMQPEIVIEIQIGNTSDQLLCHKEAIESGLYNREKNLFGFQEEKTLDRKRISRRYIRHWE